MKPFTYFALGLMLAILIAQCAGCHTLRKEQSWDQENLHNQAAMMVCRDRSIVYGTQNGVLKLCQ